MDSKKWINSFKMKKEKLNEYLLDKIFLPIFQ